MCRTSEDSSNRRKSAFYLFVSSRPFYHFSVAFVEEHGIWLVDHQTINSVNPSISVRTHAVHMFVKHARDTEKNAD